MPEIGQNLSQYSLVEKTGKYGKGEVYLAEELNLSRKVLKRFIAHTIGCNGLGRIVISIKIMVCFSLSCV
jgi:hypothetical protein